MFSNECNWKEYHSVYHMSGTSRRKVCLKGGAKPALEIDREALLSLEYRGERKVLATPCRNRWRNKGLKTYFLAFTLSYISSRKT